MQEGRGTADNHQTPYRSDLDGLRAIAVLAVIVYHLSPKLLPGGYLGVDIFFVLSGYLITNIIWREALLREFSIARFYERRVRRIMPALLFLLMVVSVCSLVLLLPIDLIGYAKSVFATLGFVANIYFWRNTDYFSRLAEEKPLLHIWSLGVEEQFYILFPLLVILCVRWRRSALLPITAVLVMLSLLANTYALYRGAFWPAFYLLPTRAWEIGVGALLALAPPLRAPAHWLRQMLAMLAVILLIAGLYFDGFSLGQQFPVAIWAVFGAALAIHLGSIGGSWLTRSLSMTALVWIGLISYSLYLWHWPILVFARYYFVRSILSPLELAPALALMFALAILSWRYIERPFRDRSLNIRSVLIWVAGGCAVVAITSAATLVHEGFPARFNANVARINAAVGNEFRCGLNDYFTFGALHACALNLPSNNPADAAVVLLGNSHAQMYAPLISDFLRQNRINGMLVPLNSCRPMPDLNVSQECMMLAAKNLRAIEALPDLRIVVLAMSWDPPTFTPTGMVPKGSETKFLVESLDRLIDHLKQLGITVVLVGPLATPESDTASIVARQMAFHHSIEEPTYAPESQFIAKQAGILAHFSSRDDMIFIRPDRIQCQHDRCDYIRDGEAIFADYSHVTQGALHLFRPVFDPGIKQALQEAHISAH
jgi:peptidoglycan/LPS O-acetylase OafA/YrhL